MYFSKIEKNENYLFVTIPDDILKSLDLIGGDEIEIQLNNEKNIVITKKQKKEK